MRPGPRVGGECRTCCAPLSFYQETKLECLVHLQTGQVNIVSITSKITLMKVENVILTLTLPSDDGGQETTFQ